MSDDLEAVLRAVVEDAVREAVDDVLEGGPAGPQAHGGDRRSPPEPWASRIWHLEPETRLTLEQVADALDCSPRQVRRYLAGETRHPKLPASDGPTGKTVQAGDLCRWIKDAERAEQFREAS